MSDSNQTGLYFTEETGTWGTTPSVALGGIRFTGESLSYNIENIVSNEIRTDRQVTDLIQTGSENAGGFEFELSYSAFDDFMEGALWDDWTSDLGISLSTVAGTSVTIGSVTATGFATTTASGFTGISAGDWIRVAGFTESGNNGFFQVSAIAASLNQILVSPAATAEAAGDTVTMNGSRIRNAATEHSYTIERRHDDLSPDQYFSFAGMVCNQMRISVQANSILTGSFDFMGKSCTQATASAGNGSFTDAPAYDVMNAVSNVGEIKEAGTTVASCLIQSIDFTVANNVRGLKAIGTLGNCDMGVGKVDVTGSLTAYFKDASLYTKYLNGTETSLSFKVADADGNTYIFDFPRIKFESDAVNAAGQDQDVMENISWRAIRDQTYGYTVQITKFAGS